MTAARAIERAEHALRTGQPNLACTYMRRASVLVAQDREAARRALLRARLKNARNPFEVIDVAIEEASAALRSTVEKIEQIFAPINNLQTGYALAGLTKGGAR